jgi:hypothetical protein
MSTWLINYWSDILYSSDLEKKCEFNGTAHHILKDLRIIEDKSALLYSYWIWYIYEMIKGKGKGNAVPVLN